MKMHVSRGVSSSTCMWVVMMLVLAVCDVTGNVCPTCDCLIREQNGGVSNIILGCEEGQITWYTLYGDLRVTLNPTKKGMFRTCIIVDSDVTTVVSREVVSSSPSNYRRKITGSTETKLSPLFTSSGRSKEYCISGSGSVRLYLQSDRNIKGVGKVKVHYDVEKLSSQFRQSEMEGCRPCTDQELLRSVCSSDFVAIGQISDVTHGEDRSHIRVSVSRVISQKEAIFQKPADDNSGNRVGMIHVPRKCGIRHGKGQFLFTGRLRLGQPVLHCAPRIEQWKHVLEKAVADDLLECSLDL